MANGDVGHWQAINENRERSENNSARIAVLEQRMNAVEGAVAASERRVVEKIEDVDEGIRGRLDRARNTGLVLLGIAVPVISALIGALIQSGAG